MNNSKMKTFGDMNSETEEGSGVTKTIEEIFEDGLFNGSGVVDEWVIKFYKNGKVRLFNHFCLLSQVKFPKPPKKRTPIRFSILFYPIEHDEYKTGYKVQFSKCGGSFYERSTRAFDIKEYIDQMIFMWLEDYNGHT